MNIAVVGVTGMVGQVMLQVLEERNIPISNLIPVASEKSVGSEITFKGKQYKVVSMKQAIEMKPAIALFSAGGNVSLKYAPEFAAVGTTVIDNSSAFRMDADKRLIVPEINAHTLTKDDKIIANPNCSTIQMVLALSPLHKEYRIKRLVVSTYQSITGTGVKAVQQLENEYVGKKGEMAYPYQIHRNALPHCDVFEDNLYTKEEMKLVRETQKILNDNTVAVTATAVRIPVVGGHSESVNVEFRSDFDVKDVRRLLSQTDGVTVQDNVDVNNYPMPLMAHGKDDVFVGRIRRDHSQENSLNMWIVADNLRKGAATNAVQIAQYLIENKLV
ncbi:aspartate-semialdehyde dehydrogenase [Nonlabens tegetincola]|uniref:Aspartate-semialdehyde dehydrogenase n=1 Tax=Nonlabens tegetincola TaxID=323273 RepID=A0A090Q0S5_9FLAO|nr:MULTISPECIES: aspartate-semialdehyde dehydrogenase [Nonlabens]ALM20969.1 aspartate-semialdehyde dehydrogenase [Nonlabens sp. MIC269]MEE2801478.1 aspartate-semialdehyde dehydrogenase [Bacteroidota bacterium]GAK95782.1 aspartate-semialdehyde dehydrogenase [Nonlabens tegetincola]